MVITVQCPSCAASFPVDTAKIPEGGVNARCSSCSTVFRVERPAAPPEAAPEEAPSLPEASAFDSAAVEEPEAAVPEPEADATADVEVAVAEPALEEPAAPVESPDDWVFETEGDVDASAVDVAPMETVESAVEEAREEAVDTFVEAPSDFETADTVMEGAVEVEEEPAAPESVVAAEEEPTAPEPAVEAEEEPAAPEPAVAAPEEPAAPAKPAAFTFGQRDPHDKARRLARVLVSDMIMYNPERHDRALQAGTLKEDFEDEISKSWKEYVEQVGDEMANSTDYWSEALNDVLAKGEQIF